MLRPLPTFFRAIQSNGSLLNIECDSLTGWSQSTSGGGTISQETFDSKSCFKLYAPSSSGAANVYKDVGAFGARTTVSVKCYADYINNSLPAGGFRITVGNGSDSLQLIIFANEIQYYQGTIKSLLSHTFGLDAWHELTLDINWTTGIVSIYKDRTLLITSPTSILAGESETNGLCHFRAVYGATATTVVYLDWAKVGDSLA